MRNIPEIGFMRLKQILEIIPIGKSSWWAGVKAGRYPQAIKLGPRTTVWSVQAIRTLLDAKFVSVANTNTIKCNISPDIATGSSDAVTTATNATEMTSITTTTADTGAHATCTSQVTTNATEADTTVIAQAMHLREPVQLLLPLTSDTEIDAESPSESPEQLCRS
ncbi:MAG: AlpA family phage regulatory protein [Candidatus Riflebacteria bacterium]|nr:AlpA family phage regulatory protein [Candidatus Riflebacteria bacterium]